MAQCTSQSLLVEELNTAINALQAGENCIKKLRMQCESKIIHIQRVCEGLKLQEKCINAQRTELENFANDYNCQIGPHVHTLQHEKEELCTFISKHYHILLDLRINYQIQSTIGRFGTKFY